MHPAIAPLSSIMTRNPVRVRPDERLDIVLALMMSCRLRHLPVEDGDRLVGMLSFRDVARVSRSQLSATRAERGLHLRGIEAGEIMSQPVLTAAPDELLLDAVARMIDRRISSLPVVEGERMVGIITRTDFLEPAARALDQEPFVDDRPVPVRRLMTPCPVNTVHISDGLDVARSLMHAQRIHHLPVVAADDEERLVGLLSDIDLLAAQSSSLEPLAPAERIAERHWTRVADAMEARVLTIAPEESAAEAARVLKRRRIGCLPVVSGGRLAGMLTVADYGYYLLSHAPHREAQVVTR